MIKLSNNYSIEANIYANRGNAILGIRDSGKSYTAMKAAEQLLKAGIPIIAFDPTGIWKNLKIGVNGNKGFPVVVAGGNAPDVKLTVDNAGDIIRAAMKENISLVIDLYSRELATKSSWIRIVQTAIEILLYENLDHGLRHIFIEEAAEFAPQRVQPQQGVVYSQIEKLARIGRNFNLGYTIINQRAEEVNKAILELCEASYLHKQVGRNSLNAIKDWMKVLGAGDGILKSLPGLKQGQCWVVGDGEPLQIQVLPKETFHPNPKESKTKAIPNNGSIANVRDFITRMEARINLEADPAEVNSKMLKGGKHEKMLEDLRAKLEEQKKVNHEITESNNKLVRENKQYRKAIEDVLRVVQGLTIANMIGDNMDELMNGTPITDNNPVKGVSTKEFSNSNKSGSSRILRTLAVYGGMSKVRIALITGMSHTSGTFNTYISSLKTSGFIEVGQDVLQITKAGREKVGPVEKLPTDKRDLLTIWCSHLGANSGSSRILSELFEMYPHGLTKDQVATRVGLSSASGTFNTYISKLRSLQLIRDMGKGWLIASTELMGK